MPKTIAVTIATGISTITTLMGTQTTPAPAVPPHPVVAVVHRRHTPYVHPPCSASVGYQSVSGLGHMVPGRGDFRGCERDLPLPPRHPRRADPPRGLTGQSIPAHADQRTAGKETVGDGCDSHQCKRTVRPTDRGSRQPAHVQEQQ
jgi:hypothetical protein